MENFSVACKPMVYSYQFETFKESDIAGVSKLLSCVFNSSSSQELLMWKYFKNPSGRNASIVIRIGDEIVGFMGIVCTVFLINGCEYHTGQGVDLAIDASHRRLDIFLDLITSIENQLRKTGIDFLYGFPSRDVSDINQIISVQKIVGTIPLLVRPVNLQSVLAKKKIPSFLYSFTPFLNFLYKVRYSRKVSLKKNTRLFMISIFDERFDDLWNQMASDHNVWTIRNREYLNWRFIDMPNSTILAFGIETISDCELLGYAAITTYSYNGILRGRILEIGVPSNENSKVFCQLLDTAISKLTEIKVDVIEYWMFSDNFEHNELIKRGFVPRKTKDTFQCCFVNSSVSTESLQMVYNSSNWYLSPSDRD